jgi:hypothetical protein
LNLLSELTQGHWRLNYETGQFYWVPDEQRAWQMYVKRVDNEARTVTVRFKGAPSGDYAVLLFSTLKGRVDKENLKFTSESYVTDISPKEGSMYGGSVVTITGVNFSDNPKHNPVIIGETLCLV